MARADAISNRAKLLAAAQRLLSANAAAPLDAVAAEAGVGIATLYRHFPSRDQLVRAVFSEIVEARLVPLIDATDPDPLHALRAVADAIVDLAFGEPQLAALATNFIEQTDDALRNLEAPLARLLAAAQRSGQIRADLVSADVPHFLTLALAIVSLPGVTRQTVVRYLALAFDALSPERATELPPLA